MAQTTEQTEQPEEVFDAADHQAPAPEVDYERLRKWVIKQQGRDFVQYAGLVDLLHQVSEGHFLMSTQVIQFPDAANGQTCICQATVAIQDEGGTFRQAQGIGDASPENVGRTVAAHFIRMAETRAKGRALRDLLNVGLVTVEELGGSPAGGGAPARPPLTAPPPPPQRDQESPWQGRGAGDNGGAQNQDGLTIDGRWYSRAQLYGFYQQRMNQARDRRMTVPGPLLNRDAPLAEIARHTRIIRDQVMAHDAKEGAPQ